MTIKGFLIVVVTSILLQIVLFIPFFIIYIKDCKELGKNNLAVSLKERFIAWIICFPFWAIPLLICKEMYNKC